MATALKCPNCSNEVEASAATCDGCGGAMPSADLAPTTSTERGWGADATSLDCENCGAQTVFSATEMVLECPYCGSQKVVEVPAEKAQDVVQPELIVPFKVEREKSQQLFREWVNGLWFAPGDLKTMADAGKGRGVYLPFWAFDVETNSYYSAEIGHDADEQESRTETLEDGTTVERMETSTTTHWTPAWGWRRGSYENILVCASKGVERSLVEAIEPWEMEDRKAYAAAMLAGWEAERYAVEEEPAWREHGRGRVLELERSACETELKREHDTYQVRDVDVDVRFLNLRSRHMLLPAWISAYAYQGKSYKFMINGQTGEVQGERPYSAGKIVVTVIGILAFFAALGLGIGSLAPKRGGTQKDGGRLEVTDVAADANTSQDTARLIGVGAGAEMGGYTSRVRGDARGSDEGSWYRVATLPDDKVTVQLTHALTGGTDIDVEVRDSDGRTLARGERKGGENVQVVATGVIYVRVYLHAGTADLFQYRIKVVRGFK